MQKVPIFVLPQISDQRWKEITEMSAEVQLMLEGQLSFFTDEEETCEN